MKIRISTENQEPIDVEIGERCYIDFAGEVGVRQRQPNELVTPSAIVAMDMDAGGLLAGIQIEACDPFGHPVWQMFQNSPQIADAKGKCTHRAQKP